MARRVGKTHTINLRSALGDALDTAKADLDKILANPNATAEEVESAKEAHRNAQKEFLTKRLLAR